MDEISIRQEMKKEAACDLRGNGVRNKSRTLKEGGEKEEGNGGGCLPQTPLFCFNRSWQHSAQPGWH